MIPAVFEKLFWCTTLFVLYSRSSLSSTDLRDRRDAERPARRVVRARVLPHVAPRARGCELEANPSTP
jgi:hypothetical protein